MDSAVQVPANTSGDGAAALEAVAALGGVSATDEEASSEDPVARRASQSQSGHCCELCESAEMWHFTWSPISRWKDPLVPDLLTGAR